MEDPAIAEICPLSPVSRRLVGSLAMFTRAAELNLSPTHSNQIKNTGPTPERFIIAVFR